MTSYDVVILGSGFAGSLLGLLLRKQGLSVLIVDRAKHPRFAIGESSTPAADFILESLCEQYSLPQLRPLCRYGSWCRELPQISRGLKRGFSYFHHRPGQRFDPGPEHENELLVAASSHNEVGDTHWYRADVDHYLAQQFVESEGVLWEDAQVESAVPGSPWELLITPRGERVRAEFIVDGTGGDSALVKWLNLKSQVASCSTYSRSLFGHFRDVSLWGDLLRDRQIDQRDYPYPCDQAALHHVIDGGWMWVLRFDNGITSVGWSLDPRQHPATNRLTPWEEWTNLLNRYPSIASHLASARPTAPFSTDRPLIRTDRLQRRVRSAAGASWALLPHTAGFIDPFYSTGIGHSLRGVERLAGIIGKDRPARAETLQRYSESVDNEIDMIDQLVSLAFRSMGGNPQLLHAASMLYFAAATTFESRRRSGQRGDFLLADDPQFCRVVTELQTTFPHDVASERAVQSWTSQVESRIAPWNSVGLFQPRHRNQYWHTAAEKD